MKGLVCLSVCVFHGLCGALGAVDACSGNKEQDWWREEQEVPSWPLYVRGRMCSVFVLTVRYQSRRHSRLNLSHCLTIKRTRWKKKKKCPFTKQPISRLFPSLLSSLGLCLCSGSHSSDTARKLFKHSVTHWGYSGFYYFCCVCLYKAVSVRLDTRNDFLLAHRGVCKPHWSHFKEKHKYVGVFIPLHFFKCNRSNR